VKKTFYINGSVFNLLCRELQMPVQATLVQAATEEQLAGEETINICDHLEEGDLTENGGDIFDGDWGGPKVPNSPSPPSSPDARMGRCTESPAPDS
jgi:hypothetical protein